MLSEEILYPVVGAAMALGVYFLFFHEAKKTTKEQSDIDQSLLDAAQAGDLEACKEAVEEEGAFLPSGTEHIDKKGKKSALHTAAQYGQNEVVEWLVLRQDVPVDIPDWSEMRPLHYAAMKGRTKTCKLLLRMKADPAATDTMKYSCVHFAASGGYEETLDVLKKHGGDVNARDHGGFTPLMLASAKGKGAAVQWLLDNGADKFAWNEQEATALDLALRRQHKSVIAILEGKPAKVVPQSQRQEAEQIMLDREEKAPTAGVAKIPGAEKPLRQRKNISKEDQETDERAKAKERVAARRAAKEQLEKQALEMAKKHRSGQEQAEKVAKKLTKAGIGEFQSGMDPKLIKENFPDAWERAREEISGLEGGVDALESMLDTVE